DMPIAVGITCLHPAGIVDADGGQVTPVAGAFLDDSRVVHLNRTIGALLGAALAADAPILDDDLAIVAAVNRADRAADHAHRIQAGSAGGGDQILVNTRPLEKKPAPAVVMSADTRLHAFVAARAALQV